MTAARKLFDQYVLPLFEQTRSDWLTEARAAARKIAAENGEVNINEVRAICPPPKDIDGRVMGAVFTRKEFVRIGFQNSDRKECHGRPVCIFALKGVAHAPPEPIPA